MEILIVLVVWALFMVIPVMIGARIVDAKYKGFGSAMFAVLALLVLSALIRGLFGNDLLGILLLIVFGTLVLARILGTTLLKALAVSILAFLIQYGLIVLIALFLGAAMGSVQVAW